MLLYAERYYIPQKPVYYFPFISDLKFNNKRIQKNYDRPPYQKRNEGFRPRR